MTDSTGTGNLPEPQGATQVQKPGELIRARREAAGMSQAQVGEALHLTVHYIKSLENDEYAKLPGLTFVKGYIRSYARLLKLDEADIIDCYDRYVATLGLPESTQEHTMRVRRRNDQAILWAIVASVILVIGLGTGWWFFGREDATAATTVVATQSRNAVSAPGNVQALQSNAPGNVQPASTSRVQSIVTPAAVTVTLTDPAMDSVAAEPEVPANTITLMTEDGPVILSDDPAAMNAVVELPDTGAAPALDAALTEAPAGPAAPDNAVPGDTVQGDAALGDAAPEETAANETTLGDAAPGEAAPAATTVATTTPGTNTRRVELAGTGADQLELQFAGNSWVEVDDSTRVRLYSDMMRNGDALSIKATAPFHILLGDATGVSVLLNGQPLVIARNIRSDKTARIMISAEGVSAWVVE